MGVLSCRMEGASGMRQLMILIILCISNFFTCFVDRCGIVHTTADDEDLNDEAGQARKIHSP